ncbi:glycerophosphodiester phosphodiesterase [Citrobacter sp. Marseille-Q6884]|uniref:glycerophosphodiester phosphodiesterase n=1 Tax=Citrobacter sp. Marseille-Q6884 TaxID=2956786 RepID=UPI0021B42B66|nr:glycerophosphodiester phosphodiesterase [Citrobacter sp. Marseille-Q6884]
MFVKKSTLIMLLTLSFSVFPSQKVVIAHRGASGYLPEHTLEAKAFAYAQGADYLEQDVVLTKDNRLVILHDLFLDDVTDVAIKFPGRSRPDGRFYAIDFTLDEILQLHATSRFRNINNKPTPIYPNRFPIFTSNFRLHTLEDEIEFIQGLNKSTKQNRGLFIEIKNPAFHMKEGKDISKSLLSILKEYGYTSKTDNIYIQCIDPNELKRIKFSIGPETGVNVKLTQLIAYNKLNAKKNIKDGEKSNHDDNLTFTPQELAEIAKYADAISPDFQILINKGDGKITVSHLTKYAHKNGLKVIPFTVSSDALPSYIESVNALYDLMYKVEGVDGLFSDHPDQAIMYLKENNFR